MNKRKAVNSTWLDSIPDNWGISRLGHFSKIYAGGTPDKANPEYWGGKIPWLNSGAVNQWYVNEPSEFITEDGFRNSSARWIPEGSLVMALAGQGKTKGMCAQLGFATTCNQSLAAIVPESGSNRYLLYWLTANYRNIRGMASDDLRDGLNLVLLGQIPVPSPPIEEQKQIAFFLDTETERIESLIREKIELISLLREYKKSTVTLAVTRGINPNVEFCTSGIPELGDVPIHWVVGKVKRFFTSLDGKRIPLSGDERTDKGGEYPYYGASGIIDYLNDFIFDEDLILVSEDGANLLSRVTPISFVARGKYWVNNHAHVIRPIDENLIFWSERIEALDLSPFITGSAQPKLTSDALNRLIISCPPSEDERKAIQDYIVVEKNRIDALITHTEEEIALLKELRAATIADAVIGRIDVRTQSNH